MSFKDPKVIHIRDDYSLAPKSHLSSLKLTCLIWHMRHFEYSSLTLNLKKAQQKVTGACYK